MAKRSEKPLVQYQCNVCGKINSRKVTMCLDCDSVNTYEEIVTYPPKENKGNISAANAALQMTNNGAESKAQLLGDVSNRFVGKAISTQFEEMNRVLSSDGGFVPGSLTLFGGAPGQGKSTLILQVAGFLGNSMNVLYVSSEEAEFQIKSRANRLGIQSPNLYVVYEQNINNIMLRHIVETKPSIIFIDSINDLYNPDLAATAGSPTQMRECLGMIQELAKKTGIPVLIVAQVTKEGIIAGNQSLQHTVDTVMYLDGEHTHMFRVLRSVKNRFGSPEIGIFEMREEGLIEVANPSEMILEERNVNAKGSALTVIVEGNRPIFMDIQSLVSQSPNNNPSRRGVGVDRDRLHQIIAVINSITGGGLFASDVLVSVVGGLQISEQSGDFAIAMSIASSMYDKVIPSDTVFLGEIDLAGGVKSISQLERRIREAAKMGYNNIYCPKHARGKLSHIPDDVKINAVKTLQEAFGMMFS